MASAHICLRARTRARKHARASASAPASEQARVHVCKATTLLRRPKGKRSRKRCPMAAQATTLSVSSVTDLSSHKGSTSTAPISSHTASYCSAAFAQVNSEPAAMAAFRILLSCSASACTSAHLSRARAMSSTELGSSSFSTETAPPKWMPVSMSSTVSTRPPVCATTGSVPKRMDSICARPQGSQREGMRLKSAAPTIA
mmetsp:Transcript_95474/g.298406  ORF Transcript_95474/g.298406 Transcript_95474/m.298406 type:complete len:200 (+) Transcript_95474:330-929(+)